MLHGLFSTSQGARGADPPAASPQLLPYSPSRRHTTVQKPPPRFPPAKHGAVVMRSPPAPLQTLGQAALPQPTPAPAPHTYRVPRSPGLTAQFRKTAVFSLSPSWAVTTNVGRAQRLGWLMKVGGGRCQEGKKERAALRRGGCKHSQGRDRLPSTSSPSLSGLCPGAWMRASGPGHRESRSGYTFRMYPRHTRTHPCQAPQQSAHAPGFSQ